jgi:hypothetical protein
LRQPSRCGACKNSSEAVDPVLAVPFGTRIRAVAMPDGPERDNTP